MRISRLTIVIFGALILLEFNNCGANIDGANNDYNSTLSACDPPDPNEINNPDPPTPNTNCALPDQNNLSINPEGGDQTIMVGQADFNVGGACNAGGYPTNVVSWELMLNGVMVRSSGMTYDGQTWNGTCADGQFLLYVNLLAWTADNNNRTGLLNPATGVATTYQLQITITGYDGHGVPYQNIVTGTETINLNPD